ncbi:LarC family nickel insertion protein (plasmid) [Loktanella salsilacus]|nr:LarC family nickel insertion protein [Loktanella salsilacus]
MVEPLHDLTAIHLDAVGGIAGDMFVATLLDCFPDIIEQVMADLDAVHPNDGSTVTLEEVTVSGMRARRFGVVASKEAAAHNHQHTNDHELHSHGSSYAQLVTHITASPLPPTTAKHALAILAILAEAEARMHAVAISDVHFHEVGDWDSVLDVVAAGSIIAALPDVRWTVSALPFGAGLVKTAHGKLPVPAPATAEILKGFEWRDDGVGGERVTPTGASILRYLCDPSRQVRRSEGTLLNIGTGAGTMTLAGIPNILRATAFGPSKSETENTINVISFDVDDMTGEEIAIAADRLRTATGVLDVSLGSRIGKKGRPLTDFRILTEISVADTIADLCLTETSTIGLRRRTERRVTLPRESGTGPPSQKTVKRPDGTITVKVESDDLRDTASLAARRKLATSEYNS